MGKITVFQRNFFNKNGSIKNLQIINIVKQIADIVVVVGLAFESFV